jgi:DNA-binding MarR family transcriptional regulator
MNIPDNRSLSSIKTANRLHRSTVRLYRALRTIRPAEGLTLSKLGVLGRLYEAGPATSTELAAYQHVKKQSLTRSLADLEQRELIVGRPNSEDRRENLLDITEAGVRVLIEDVGDQQTKLARVIEKELTPAEQKLLRIAIGLMNHIAEATEAKFGASLEKSAKGGKATSDKDRQGDDDR